MIAVEDGCCHKTRMRGAACPIGRTCPHDSKKIQNAENQKLVPQFYYGSFSDSCPPINLGLSDGLRVLVDAVINPHPDVRVLRNWSNARSDEAGSVLYELRDALRAPTGPELLAWLWPIAGSVGNPPSEGDFKRRVAGLELCSVNLPHIAFNAITQRLGLATWVLFPSVADIMALVSADVAPFMERVRALRVIAGATAHPYMGD